MTLRAKVKLKQNFTELILANSLQAKSNTIPLFLYKYSFTGTQPHLSVYVLFLAAFTTVAKNHMVYKA